MAFLLGQGELSTLRRPTHWRCNLFKVLRRGGGPTLRFSDSDRQQIYRNEIYVPTAGERYDEEVDAATSAGDTQLVGALSPSTVTQVDVQRGVYDNARVDQFVFDWRFGKRYLHSLWYVEDMAHNGRVWTAKLVTSAIFMQSTVGDAYNSTCPAVLGDERCKKVVTTESLTVSAVSDAQLGFTAGTTAVADRWYEFGFITWSTGNNKGTLSRVRASTSAGVFGLSTPTRFRIRVGDQLVASPGCNGLATTCKDKFDNLLNFRGNERQKNAKQLILSRGTVG